MDQALYGHGGFFHRPEGPAGHFRTSVQASPLFARAVMRLLGLVDDALGRPATLDLVDVGAGRGELLVGLLELLPGTGLADRVRLSGVELAARPPALPPTVRWLAELPEDLVGLVVANEWLDDVPVDVVQVGPDGTVVQVLVEPGTGHESPGGPVGVPDSGWLARWWPLDATRPGARAEVGRPRDRAWADAVRAVSAGLALAVDYGHLRAERVAGEHAAGTLAGFRDGRAVAAVPDGSCDVTAHVAVDACAAAGEEAGATRTVLLRQRDALRSLGVEAGRPDPGLASADPASYARALTAASQAAELLEPAGLGGFWWLLQTVGPVTLPDVLGGLAG